MNERIKDLKEQALIWAVETLDPDALNENEWAIAIDEKFAELIVAKVLDEVATRAYVSGDRAWSDNVDRQWIELEFGYGKLYDAKTFRS